MPVFSKHSDHEYEVIAKKLKTAEQLLGVLQNENTQIQESVRASKEQNELLEEEIGHLRRELEESSADNKNREKRISTLEGQISESAVELKDSIIEKRTLESELKKLQAIVEEQKIAFEALKVVESDLRSENDLILAQLHQVQEELEKYYLSNRDLEAAVVQACELIRRSRYALVDYVLVEKPVEAIADLGHIARKDSKGSGKK